MKKLSYFCKKNYNVCLLIILVVSGFIRLFMIDSVPVGFHIDEAAMGYDAWSLANYGVDRWQIKYPIYLMNFGQGQSPLMAYSLMILYKMIPLELPLWFIRIPGILFNLAGLYSFSYIINHFHGKKYSLIGAFLYSVSPYFIMQCRIGLDCNLLVCTLLIAIALTIWAIKKETHIRFFIAGIAWGISYYSYAISYIPNTIIITTLVLVLLVNNKKRLSKLIVMLVPIIILGLPLFLVVIINQFNMEQFQIWKFTFTKLHSYRSNEISFNPINIICNIPNVLKSILFFDWLPYNSIKEFGVLYYFSIPFILLGFIKNISDFVRNRRNQPALFFSPLLIFSVYIIFGCMLQGDGANVNKLNALFFPQLYFLVVGISCFTKIITRKSNHIGKISEYSIILLYITQFVLFGHFYFYLYSDNYNPMFLYREDYASLLSTLPENTTSLTFIDGDGDYYIYYLLFNHISPDDYLLSNVILDKSHPNFVLKYPDSIIPNSYYLVRKTDNTYIQKLLDYGTVYEENRHYVLIKT